MDFRSSRRLGLERSLADGDASAAVVNGRSNQVSGESEFDAQYLPCPEADPGKAVARGNIVEVRDWAESDVFAGTRRDLWVYTPAQLEAASEPPALLVVNDGIWYLAQDGQVRAAAVLDSLIHAGEIPPTAAVFVMPGTPEGAPGPRELPPVSCTRREA